MPESMYPMRTRFLMLLAPVAALLACSDSSGPATPNRRPT